MITLGSLPDHDPPLRPATDEPVVNANGAEADAAGDDGECYRLISIDAVAAPDGCSGGDWFVYRIAQGGNAIKGYRCGNLERVSADVQSIVTSLNGRRTWTKIKPVSDRQRRAAAAARRAAR